MAITYGKNYGRPTLDLNFAENKSLIDSVTGRNLITFSRSQSGKEATYVGSDGLIKYAGADEPRFDYDPVSGVCKGLLIEEQRTNLFTYSTDITQSAWNKANSSTPLPSSEIAPDGSTDSYILNVNAVPTSYISLNVPTVAGTVYTISVWAKNVPGEQNYFDLFFNTVSTVQRGKTALTDTWTRYHITGTATQTANVLAGINNPPDDYVARGLFWGFQFEQGSFPTSYIPTSGAQVTRNADEASITGTNFSSWYNQSEGTIFAGVSSFSYNNSATLPTFAHFTDGSLNNYIKLNSGPSYLVRNFTNTGGVTQTQAAVNIAPANNSPYSIALGLTTNNARIYADGNPAALINSYSPPVVNKVEIGNWIAQNNTWTNGHLSRLTYWPKRLPDLELQQLTK